MQQLWLKKANAVAHPGSRGGKFWVDDKGTIRYDEKPTGEKRPHKYLALIELSDGTKKYISPNDDELDDKGQVVGGTAKIREIINRELFGEYGFKTDGNFWQTKGILVEYKTRVTARGKIEVDAIERHKGYTNLEFRDSSVSRAYGAELPKKITQYKVDAGAHDAPPTKDKIEIAGTADVPTIEELGIHTTPPRKPQTEVAIAAKLKPEDDPIALATAYLDATFGAKKPSQAKTEAGQQRARDAREGQFDDVVGARQIKRLPIWAIAKWRSPAELQTALSRGEDGQPLTTLITLGAWNPDNKSKRFREQLLSEWSPFIRRWSRRFASVYSSTDSYRKFDKIDGGAKAQTSWMYDRERDLFNEAVMVLLDEANKYMSNDEPRGPDSRFDLKAQNAIKNHLEKHAKQAAVEHHGATYVEDLSEEDAYHAPKTISPREQFEIRHYEPQAIGILSDILTTLKPEERAVFEARLWIDDYKAHPDQSQEHAFNEAREARKQKHGESNLHWGRPWVRTKEGGMVSVADKLADTMVSVRGKPARLGDLTPQNQKHHLERWFNDAMARVESHLKTKNDRLTPDGQTVEKWLRLEAKLAHVNTKEITDRTEHKLVAMPSIKHPRPAVEHNRAVEHPAITFFKQPGSNRDLAAKLGITDDLDVPVYLKDMNLPKQQEAKLNRINDYHQRLQSNLKHVGNLGKLHDEAHAEMERHRNMGSWTRTNHGTSEWHEDNGVAALHEAAMKLHATKGADDKAVTAYTNAANALGKDHPMVQDYTRRLHTLGADVPTSADLATWKNRSHAAYREHANRMHIIEFAQEQRNAKKSLVDLRDAFAKCFDAFDDLRKAFQ